MATKVQRTGAVGFFPLVPLTQSPVPRKSSVFAEWNCEAGAVVRTVWDVAGVQKRERRKDRRGGVN